MTLRDRILGCILGGAIGDALGGPYEGATGPLRIDGKLAWRLSDDTQLTLATCEAIVACGQVEAAAIAGRMKEWFAAGRVTGIGGSSFKALNELTAGGHWALVGARGEMAAGNGAAMRNAPLAFCLSTTDVSHRVLIRDVCRITHHHEEAYAGALAVVAAVKMAAEGRWTSGDNPLRIVESLLPDSLVRERLSVFASPSESGDVIDLATRFGCSGYVVESVPLALFGAQFVDTVGFQAALEKLIQAGGDTDTIGSIAGQIMGTACGRDAIHVEWTIRLLDSVTLVATAESFADVVS